MDFKRYIADARRHEGAHGENRPTAADRRTSRLSLLASSATEVAADATQKASAQPKPPSQHSYGFRRDPGPLIFRVAFPTGEFNMSVQYE